LVSEALQNQARQHAFLLLGPTAAGKSPLGDMIATRGVDGRRCVHFDFGRELRGIAASGADGFSAEEVAFIRGVLEEGLLLEDEHFHLARKIFSRFLDREGVERNDRVVMNGLPRHRGQAEGMSDIVDISTVIVLSCSEDSIMCRIRENTGGDRAGRPDDDLGMVKKKIALYNQRTAPLVDYYRQRGADIISIEVTPSSTPASVYGEFLEKYMTTLAETR